MLLGIVVYALRLGSPRKFRASSLLACWSEVRTKVSWQWSTSGCRFYNRCSSWLLLMMETGWRACTFKWKFLSYRLWRSVAGRADPDVWIDPTSFIFRVKQYFSSCCPSTWKGRQ